MLGYLQHAIENAEEARQVSPQIAGDGKEILSRANGQSI